jgi:hypothetical protein
MISAESQPLPTSGELADAVAAVAADPLFAQPVPIAGTGGAVAWVISQEQLAMLQRALDESVDQAPPLSPRELADSLGLAVAVDGTFGVRGG